MANNEAQNNDNGQKKPSLFNRVGAWISSKKGYIVAFFGGAAAGVGGTLLVQKIREEGTQEEEVVEEQPLETMLQ
jgi:hypothetical protein